MEKSKTNDIATATARRKGGMNEGTKADGYYTATCRRADGTVKWTDDIRNLVTTQGRNDALDKHLGAVGYTAAWFLGLVASTGYAALDAGDTAAEINGTNGWKEAGTANDPDYESATRPAIAFDAAVAGVKEMSDFVTFVFTTAGTVKGCFVCSSSVKDGTAGVLYSVGLFQLGDKAFDPGDELDVSYQASLS